MSSMNGEVSVHVRNAKLTPFASIASKLKIVKTNVAILADSLKLIGFECWYPGLVLNI